MCGVGVSRTALLVSTDAEYTPIGRADRQVAFRAASRRNSPRPAAPPSSQALDSYGRRCCAESLWPLEHAPTLLAHISGGTAYRYSVGAKSFAFGTAAEWKPNENIAIWGHIIAKVSLNSSGGQGRNRTTDTRIFSPPLSEPRSTQEDLKQPIRHKRLLGRCSRVMLGDAGLETKVETGTHPTGPVSQDHQFRVLLRRFDSE